MEGTILIGGSTSLLFGKGSLDFNLLVETARISRIGVVEGSLQQLDLLNPGRGYFGTRELFDARLVGARTSRDPHVPWSFEAMVI